MPISNSNQNRYDQLGMSYGKALGRLKKQVLYSLLKRHQENICYRCSKEIDSWEELSLEHKQPWLHVSPELFWDLDNISFSHLVCNIRAARKANNKGIPSKRRKIGPEGYSWCQSCEDFLPIDLFTKNKSRWNGLQKDCIDCRSKNRSPRIYNKRKQNLDLLKKSLPLLLQD